MTAKTAASIAGIGISLLLATNRGLGVLGQEAALFDLLAVYLGGLGTGVFAMSLSRRLAKTTARHGG